MVKKCIQIIILSFVLLGTMGCEVKEVNVDTVFYEFEENREGIVLGQLIELRSKEGQVVYYKETASIKLEKEEDYQMFEDSMEEMNKEDSSRNKEGITFSSRSNKTNKEIINTVEIDFDKASKIDGASIIGVQVEEDQVSLEKVEEKLVKDGLVKKD